MIGLIVPLLAVFAIVRGWSLARELIGLHGEGKW